MNKKENFGTGSSAENIKSKRGGGWRRNLLRTMVVVFGLFAAAVIARIPFVIQNEKTAEQVAKIHATKLTMADVMGENLPPEPDPLLKDATVAGIDANKNGIRDDVELAIFKEYPNSAKTRAVLLQYALVLQMQMTLPIVNKETVTATVEDKSRADICVWSLSSRSDMEKFSADIERYRNFVKDLQIDTEQRNKYLASFYEHLGSYSASHNSCDLDVSNF